MSILDTIASRTAATDSDDERENVRDCTRGSLDRIIGSDGRVGYALDTPTPGSGKWWNSTSKIDSNNWSIWTYGSGLKIVFPRQMKVTLSSLEGLSRQGKGEEVGCK